MNIGTALLFFALAALFGRWHRRISLQQLSTTAAAVAAFGVVAWAVITGDESPERISAVVSVACAIVLLLTLLSFAARRWTQAR